MKFLIACNNEKIRQILDFADKLPYPLGATEFLNIYLSTMAWNRLHLGNLEKISRKVFKLEPNSLTNDQILAFNDGLVSRSFWLIVWKCELW